MTESQLIRRVIKPVVWAAGLGPLAFLVRAGFEAGLTADPVKYITHFTGRTALIILFITLTVTPLRRLTGWNGAVKLRRLIGLFAFFYAVIHLLIYLVFDRGLVFTELAEDIAKRPYITVGFTAWTFLVLLAVTSPRAVLRRIGGKRWQALHRLIYPAAVLGVLHFTWAQKKDISEPLMYAAVLGAILALRAITAWRQGTARRPSGDGPPLRNARLPGGAVR
ncbi:MAG: sulfoxide reductase heme-binding subunit YedZ [Gemmatimonadota bacterium]|nr:sulfoxide reductase heme-binding subunit YedZ [Gemmatimonadota bacterium]